MNNFRNADNFSEEAPKKVRERSTHFFWMRPDKVEVLEELGNGMRLVRINDGKEPMVAIYVGSRVVGNSD